MIEEYNDHEMIEFWLKLREWVIVFVFLWIERVLLSTTLPNGVEGLFMEIFQPGTAFKSMVSPFGGHINFIAIPITHFPSVRQIAHFESFKISNAASLPGAELIPPPGCVPLPHW